MYGEGKSRVRLNFFDWKRSTAGKRSEVLGRERPSWRGSPHLLQ